MKKNETDINLIKNILKGDNIAQNKFYEKYKKILTKYIYSKHHNNFDIEDDVSEILIKIFNNLNKYDENKASVMTWVITIAKNYMIDKFRCGLSSTVTINNNSGITLSNNDGQISSDTTIWNINDDNWSYTNNSQIPEFESINAINYISSQLNFNDFTFLNMHYNYGYTYCEIGTEFNLTSNTVSNRVNYLKSKLKKCTIEEILY